MSGWVSANMPATHGQLREIARLFDGLQIFSRRSTRVFHSGAQCLVIDRCSNGS